MSVEDCDQKFLGAAAAIYITQQKKLIDQSQAVLLLVCFLKTHDYPTDSISFARGVMSSKPYKDYVKQAVLKNSEDVDLSEQNAVPKSDQAEGFPSNCDQRFIGAVAALAVAFSQCFIEDFQCSALVKCFLKTHDYPLDEELFAKASKSEAYEDYLQQIGEKNIEKSSPFWNFFPRTRSIVQKHDEV